MIDKDRILAHWPILGLLATVFLILLLALVLFEVKENEYVVVERWKNPLAERDTSPGAHIKLPYPIETVWRADKRLHIFTGNKGELSTVLTQDERNVIVTAFLTWRIYADPDKPSKSIIRYRETIGTKEKAGEKLTDLLRSAKRSAFSQFDFHDMVNEDPAKVKIEAIETVMLEEIAETAKEKYAIEVVRVGIAHIGLPQKATAEVFERMRAERKIESDAIEAEGEAEAKKIRAEADRDKAVKLAQARAQAEEIRGQGDEAAAESYKRLQKNPELAIFLQQLTALRKILGKKTYLVLDTTTPPINLMTPEAQERLNKKGLKTIVKSTKNNE